MYHAAQQETDLWEIWIEYDPCHPDYFGTLYVIGEITVDKESDYSLSIKSDCPCERSQLILYVPPCNDVSNCYTKEVIYSEPIENLNQYTSVCIYAGNELIGKFEEIEVMI